MPASRRAHLRAAPPVSDDREGALAAVIDGGAWASVLVAMAVEGDAPGSGRCRRSMDAKLGGAVARNGEDTRAVRRPVEFVDGAVVGECRLADLRTQRRARIGRQQRTCAPEPTSKTRTLATSPSSTAAATCPPSGEKVTAVAPEVPPGRAKRTELGNRHGASPRPGLRCGPTPMRLAPSAPPSSAPKREATSSSAV
eukprot:scaffold34537_cov27-Tisochrysis_lutea.AAC.4